MRRLRAWIVRIGGLFNKRQHENELAQELDNHIQMNIEDNLRSGMSPQQARRDALIRLGGLELTKENYRHQRSIPFIEAIIQDLRFALRMMRKNPGFTCVAVFTIALGIGGNSAIFSVVDAVLLRPLALTQPERLVAFYPDYSKMNMRGAVSPPTFMDYQRQNRVFEQIAASMPVDANLTEGDDPERIAALQVTAKFFSTLGVNAGEGRVFATDEDQLGHDKVIILSERLWRRRFGGNASLLNQAIMVNGEKRIVVGIMPRGFQWGRKYGQETEADLWMPLAFTPEQLNESRRGHEFLDVYGRLKSGVSVAQAQADIDSIDSGLQKLHPAYYPPGPFRSHSVVSNLQKDMTQPVRPALLLLLTAVGFVLLIACSNVANLLMARASARQREIAVRMALGAARLRIVRQLLTESCLLALIAGGIGVVIAEASVKMLAAGGTLDIPGLRQATIDWRVLSFTLVLSVMTGMLFGVLPALQTATNEMSARSVGAPSGLGIGRWVPSRSHFSLRSCLIVGQIAVALLLLTGAGLLITSFLRLRYSNLGFRPDHLLTMKVSLPHSAYPTPEQQISFFERSERELSALPGVKAVGAIVGAPLDGLSNSGTFHIQGRAEPKGQSAPYADWWMATPGYYRTMEIPLRAGRYLAESDTRTSLPVVVISEVLARKYFPGEDPIGKRIDFIGSPDKPMWHVIVGVVGNVKQRSLDEKPRAQCYVPFAQNVFPRVTLVLRTELDPVSLSGAAVGAIHSIDPHQPVYDVTTMEHLADESLSQRRFSTFLIAVFSAVALALACVGLYGVMAYAVTQRTQEIGVRMALGARTGDVVRMILSQSLKLIVVGVVAGLAASLALTRFIASQLFEIKATDPNTFVVVAMLLALVTLIASYVPARRAAKVDPMVALRCE